jgi:hypothetical protein
VTDRPSVCSRCKATIPAHSEWCPVCFKPFTVPAGDERAEVGHRSALLGSRIEDPRPRRRAELATPRAPGTADSSSTEIPPPEDPAPAVWPCPECEHDNPIELDSCDVCGTPFARLFQEPKRSRDVEPRAAAVASLILPGLGHIRCGRTAEGIARMLMFLWAGGTGLVLSLSHAPGLPLFGVLFLFAALGVYVVSALEALRIADGGAAILPPRALLWAATVLAMLSIMSVFVVMADAT